mgnify:CR=1 FL=1
MGDGYKKYKPFERIDLPDRTWPDKTIDKAPIWCSVDLRDGNQALIDPMSQEEKLLYFQSLVEVGFKEIEVGFPSANDTEFEICRALIKGGDIPEDVTIQVLVQAREHLIRKTFDAIRGAKNVILHFYSSTSTLQRTVVYEKDMVGSVKIATAAVTLIRDQSGGLDTGVANLRFQSSPETVTCTAVQYAGRTRQS